MALGHRYNKYHDIKEYQIENYLVKQIEKLGGIAIKFNPHNNRGLPDRICFIPGGRVILVELKRPGQRPRKNQIRQLSFFKKMGFQATWADTYEKVDKLIEYIKQWCSEYKVFHVEHLCLRRDCPLRRQRK